MNMINAYEWKTLDDVRELATLYHDSVWDKESSLGMQWLDKPHRNIYDLVYLVRQLADKLEESGLPETPDFPHVQTSRCLWIVPFNFLMVALI